MIHLARMSLQTLIIQLTEAYQSKRWVRVALVTLIVFFTVLSIWFGYTRLDVETAQRYGYVGIFFINLLTCATILVPVPGGAAVNIAAGSWMNPLAVTLIAACGSTIGELTSYLAGSLGHNFLASGYSKRYAQAERLMNRLGAFAVFLFALLPMLLYDLIGLIAGSTRYTLWKFITATFVGRVLRHAVQVYVGYSLAEWFLFR